MTPPSLPLNDFSPPPAAEAPPIAWWKRLLLAPFLPLIAFGAVVWLLWLSVFWAFYPDHHIHLYDLPGTPPRYRARLARWRAALRRQTVFGRVRRFLRLLRRHWGRTPPIPVGLDRRFDERRREILAAQEAIAGRTPPTS